MSVKRVDLDKQGWTYSSYVIAGDFIFTSICSGKGETITEQTETALTQLTGYLGHAQATLDDVVKVTVTFKRGENCARHRHTGTVPRDHCGGPGGDESRHSATRVRHWQLEMRL
jgi:enamine deaminase RidA (YjgF/YER057c/UK114 family)